MSHAGRQRTSAPDSTRSRTGAHLWTLGALVLAGALALSSAMHSSVAQVQYAPSLQTGQPSYAAGDEIEIAGTGFAPGESVTLTAIHADGTAEAEMGHEPFVTVADDAGHVAATWTIVAGDTVSDQFVVRAAGAVSGQSQPVGFVRSAVVAADANAYAAGDTVTITGRDFSAGESVTVQVTHEGGGAEPGMDHQPRTITVGANGTFAATWVPNLADEAGARFTVTAAGNISGDAVGTGFTRVAVLSTDKGDYQPGETATITGRAFAPNELVVLQVRHLNGHADGDGHDPFYASSDAAGTVAAEWYVDPDDSLGSKFLLTGIGQTSGVAGRATFWDAGAVSLTMLGVAYAQNFDTLASTGTSSAVPIGWDLFETGTNANTTYTAGTGSSTTGDTYSFGAAASTERAFGGLQSGSLVPTIGVQFTNSTGSTITGLTISYTGEMWRAGVVNRNAADRLDFQLSTDATSLSTGTWVNHDGLDFGSPNINTTVGLQNGNADNNRTPIAASIGSLNVAAGASFWIRWTDFNIANSDDGLAVDDFALTVTGLVAESAPAVASTVPVNGATNVPLGQNLTITFTEPVNVSDPWFSLTCGLSGAHTATVSGGPTAFTLDPAADFVFGESCTLVIDATRVTDLDGNDPPDTMVVNFTAGFTAEIDACTLPFTPAFQIQGSGLAAAITGVVTTRGVVVGDYEYPGSGSTANFLRGFFLQDVNGDGDAATSDAVFVFGGNNNSVSLGDVVSVTGTAGEFQDQTQVSATVVRRCGTGSVAPVDVTLPAASATDLERFEGMLVRLPQTLSVTEHFQLGRFGQVVLSANGRLPQPTNVVAPGAPALALQAQNNLNRIVIDDASQAQNPDPILFGRNGNPLSASNTLRGGDTATGIVGVLNYTWGGTAASPNAYRVRPLNALDGSVTFVEANPRPAAPPVVGGTLKVVGMNLLNFFNTFADGNAATPGCFRSGTDGDCRGASNATEFARQHPKTVAAILSMNPDVIGINEIENDGYGPSSALAFLVDRLNTATAAGTYAYIDVDAGTGQLNAMGTDAIKVGLIYKPGVVTPVGQTAALNSLAFVNGGDSGPRSRASLAQAFEQTATRARLVVNVNHLKSKGSACDAPDAGDGQGNCNLVRTNAAHTLTAWLASDPTGINDADVLMLGDYNAYAKEDPIAAIQSAGFTNLIETLLGADAYSYAFDGQWGYLDHALGSASLVGQVTGVGDHHINADEPSVLDYSQDFKSAGQLVSLYAPDQFRISDHDPVIVGLTLRNDPPSADAGGPYSILEGGSVTLLASGADPDGTPVTFAWDLDGDGVFETPGQTASFTRADGPAAVTVALRVTDATGVSTVTSTTVIVHNVAPGISRLSVSAPAACGQQSRLTIDFSDPALGSDSYMAVVNWGDGQITAHAAFASGSVVSHAYALAGRYTASVTVSDEDGGTSTAATAVLTTNYTVVGGGILQPINQNGTSVFKYNSTIPVKLAVADCNGTFPSNLTIAIALGQLSGSDPGGVINEPASTSAADTDGVMRYTGNQYLFNLATKPLPDPSATYRITLTILQTGQTVEATFGLRP